MSKIAMVIAGAFVLWAALAYSGAPGHNLVEYVNTAAVPTVVAMLFYTAPPALRALRPKPEAAHLICLSLFLMAMGVALTRGVYSTAMRAFGMDWLRNTTFPSFTLMFYAVAPIAFFWAFRKPGHVFGLPRPGWGPPLAFFISACIMAFVTFGV